MTPIIIISDKEIVCLIESILEKNNINKTDKTSLPPLLPNSIYSAPTKV